MECIFCKIVKGEIESDKVGESENFFAFKDKNPRISGHTLIIPKGHYETFLDIPDNLGEEFFIFAQKTIQDLLEKQEARGFNIGMNNGDIAGQIIKHAHFHILPRKDDKEIGSSIFVQ